MGDLSVLLLWLMCSPQAGRDRLKEAPARSIRHCLFKCGVDDDSWPRGGCPLAFDGFLCFVHTPARSVPQPFY